MTDIFCLLFFFFPLLSQIITVLSATEQKVTLLKTSSRGANLQGSTSVSEVPHDKTQVSVKKQGERMKHGS